MVGATGCGKAPSDHDGVDAPKSSGGSDAGPGGVITDGPPLVGTPYSLQYPTLEVAPGEENTQCIWLNLSNTSEITVHQVHNILSNNTHHLIVYKDDMDTTEQTTPVDCQPFAGALNATGNIEPIVITQAKDDELTLPDGVAYTLAANQMIKLEMHYINTGEGSGSAFADVNFYAVDPSTITDEAAVLFTGSPDIQIPANQQFTLHEYFQVPTYMDLSKSNLFAITGHEHHWGTGVSINVAPDGTGPFTNVYDPSPFLWAEPATETFATPFGVPLGGGFDFTCTWNNMSSAEVDFGESANDEMCFFWAYYYPALTVVNSVPTEGSEVCIHTEQYGGLNACCPGDGLCAEIQQSF
jgi:hypothetical protein